MYPTTDNVRINTPDAYSRQSDTEFKILNDIDSRLGTNTSTKGVINLFTERRACAGCSDVIMEFRHKYPNIQLNVFAGK